MPKTAPIQTGFVGGRFGPRMAGRVDLARYPYGCKTLNNFIPTVQGPLVKRSGTRFVKAVMNQAQTSRLIPFEFSRDQAYMLEFGENAIRFMRSSGAVLETAVAISGNPTIAANCEITTGASHGYATGDEVYVSGSSLAMLNGQFFTITVKGATTFTIGQDTQAEVAAGGPGTVARVYEINDGVSSNSIPWSHDELDGLAFAQSADVLYIVHPDYPPHKLSRTSDTSWTCLEIEAQWPCFREENITDTTVYVSAATGTTVTVQASADIFTADMVGGYIKVGEIIEIKHPLHAAGTDLNYGTPGVGDTMYYGPNVYRIDVVNGAGVAGNIPPAHDEGIEMDRPENGWELEFINRGWGYAKIETFTDANTIVVDVDNWGIEFPASVVGSTLATKKWAISAFNDEFGYPSAVALFEERLWLGGTEKDPQTFWGSKTNRFEDFELIPDEADAGMVFTLASNRINAIQWMTGEDLLVIGTRGGEYTVRGTGETPAITPDNIEVRQRSAFGSATNVAPRFVDSALLMVQRNAKRLHELIYDFDTDRYKGVDLTEMSDDIMGSGARELAYQAAPFRQLWAVTTDGDLVAMTYVREQEVWAWANFPIGTVPGGATPDVESIAVIPHPDGDEDQLWLVVNRTIGGNTRRWIEYLEKPFEPGDAIGDAFFLDAGSTYSGSAATAIYGLLHLAGTTATLNTGGTVSNEIVSSKGMITVDSTTKAQIGYAFQASFETMDLEMGDTRNSSQGERGRVVSAVFRVNNMGAGLEYGQSLSGTLDAYDPTAGTLETGDLPEFTLPGGFSRSRIVAARHVDPLPCTIISVMPKPSMEAS